MNTRRVRRIFPAIGVGVAVLLLVVAGAIWLFGAPAGMQQAAAIGGPFTLEGPDGKPVTDEAFRGKVMLVYFGYTFCPDVCPTTLNDVAQALDKLGARADKLAPVFITVDPARDTPAVMKQYTAAFSPRIEGLTGTAEQIKAVAREYRVYYAPHRTGPNPGDYTMDHSSILYVVAPNGQFAGIIRADEGPDAMAADLSKYLS
jgi:protein SCO1/2